MSIIIAHLVTYKAMDRACTGNRRGRRCDAPKSCDTYAKLSVRNLTVGTYHERFTQAE